MPRRQPRNKVSRRFGADLFGTGGASLRRRLGTPPGGLPHRRRRLTHYAEQLREKQKVKAVYGVAERQFRHYVDLARRMPGETGANLLTLLERRLDNVVYRLGLARSRPMARQLVSHGHVEVDRRRVNIASFLVEPGQEIRLRDSAREIVAVIDEREAGRPIPGWLERDEGGLAGRVLRDPERGDVELAVDDGLILGFYSR